jgi:MTH538 TIR-like domain (DUF1863)
VASRRQRDLQAWIDRRQSRIDLSLREAQKAARHKCFVSFHHVDDAEVVSFLEEFEPVFIPRVLGVSDEDEFIDSDDTDYVMDQIRELYLTDSSVTLVLVGKCTWARRYVDWEVYSTLRNDKRNRRSGLVAITLPSAAAYVGKKLPPRVDDNVSGDDGYAQWYTYPSSEQGLRGMIQEAFDARATKAGVIDNSRMRKKYNSLCP